MFSNPRYSLRWHHIAATLIVFALFHICFSGHLDDGIDTARPWISLSNKEASSNSKSDPYDNSAELAANNFIANIYPEPLPDTADKEERIAICAAMKGTTWDLPEWLQHHYYHLGIRRFYIMDDGSIPPLANSISTYGVPPAAVTFIYFPRATRIKMMQYPIYQECIRMFGIRHEWMAFIDADEFIEMTAGNETLGQFLQTFEKSYNDTGAIAMNWWMHNSNNLIKKPPKGTCRKSFTSCLSDKKKEQGENTHIKSIVRPKFWSWTQSPHHFALLNDTKTRGENGDEVNSHMRSPATRNRIALHHYAVKSREQFEQKHRLGSANSNHKPLDWIDMMDARDNETCDSLANYYP